MKQHEKSRQYPKSISFLLSDKKETRDKLENLYHVFPLVITLTLCRLLNAHVLELRFNNTI